MSCFKLTYRTGQFFFQNLNSYRWVAPTTRTKTFASMPSCLLISTSAFRSSFVATNVILFLINFHCTFLFLDTDAALHIACKAISPILKLFHIQPVFSISWKFKQKIIFKSYTLTTNWLLFNQLLMSISYSKTLFLFYFYFFWSSKNQVPRSSLQTTWHLYGFLQTKNGTS